MDAVLRAAPSLGFLTAAPFMGYGGDTSAASMDVKVRNHLTPTKTSELVTSACCAQLRAV